MRHVLITPLIRLMKQSTAQPFYGHLLMKKSAPVADYANPYVRFTVAPQSRFSRWVKKEKRLVVTLPKKKNDSAVAVKTKTIFPQVLSWIVIDPPNVHQIPSVMSPISNIHFLMPQISQSLSTMPSASMLRALTRDTETPANTTSNGMLMVYRVVSTI